MCNIKSQELRKIWKDFWETKKHNNLNEACLLTPAQETTTLFNQSGMQQLIPYFVWKTHKSWFRLYNIQKCIRTIDIDEVWDRSHLTFFEMMWNWSLGDYFKKESVQRSWEFLTEYIKISPRKLAVTVFEWDESSPRDNETANYRKKIWVNEDKISYMNAKENRWSPGPVWPCGPDTEIFYWVGDKNGGPEFPPKDSNVKNDEDNWMEIRNNVFIQHYRDESWLLTNLEKNSVDTGMWFERMCLVLQNKDTIFETDLFEDIIKVIEKWTEIKYSKNKKRVRIIADHLRTAALMIQDGAIASNVGSGYILRMIIRRMYYNFILLKDISEKDFEKFICEIISIISELNPHRKLPQENICENLIKETESFRKTISRWIKLLDEKMWDKKEKKIWEREILLGQDAFMLYDTYGFPIEITKEICEAKWRDIDMKTFDEEMEKARKRSRKATEKMFDKWIDWSKYLAGIDETEFIWYDNMLISSENNDNKNIKLLKDFDVNWQRILIFNKTPFYAESGGQVWDFGSIELDNWEGVKISKVIRYEGVFLHFV